MKKGLVSFSVIKKHKYIFFTLWSILVSTITWLLTYAFGVDYPLFSDRSLLFLAGVAWINFPMAFILFHYANKKDKKNIQITE